MSLTVVDLFCGAGGLSLGCKLAGFRAVAAYDCWLPAVETYRSNLGLHCECERIDRSLDLPPADVIVGGPPCQGFSSAGLRREHDHRNTLVEEFAQLVSRLRPRAFLFENVEGFLTGGRGRFVFDLLTPLVAAGYQIHLRKVNAANYGVPQHRKRVVAVGGLGWIPSFPRPTHSAFGAPGADSVVEGLPATPTLGEALVGLPSAEPCANGVPPHEHAFVPLSAQDFERADALKPGQRMRDLPEHLWHESYRRRAYRRVMDGTPTERRGGAPAGIRRLRIDEPSKAITGGAINEFIHPTENRSLTIRECARLQTFPDDFRVLGNQRDAIQQIGNAVPPLLGYCLATQLLDDLLSNPTIEDRPGALVSFQPTHSTGMSPILDEVDRKVRTTFGLSSRQSTQYSFSWL